MAGDYADLPVIDLAQPDWWREPMVVTAPMHAANAPAAYVPTFGTVFFLRYEDNLSGLNDPNLMAMGARYFEMQGWTEGAFVDWIRLNVVMMNPPGHTRPAQAREPRVHAARGRIDARRVPRIRRRAVRSGRRQRWSGRVRARMGAGPAAAGGVRDDRYPACRRRSDGGVGTRAHDGVGRHHSRSA